MKLPIDETPRGGWTPVLAHLLAPNPRAEEVTRDFAVRKEFYADARDVPRSKSRLKGRLLP